MAPWLSIVIPARNDAEALARTLDHLQRLPGMHGAEVIVAAAGDPAGTARAVAGRARLLQPDGSTRAELMNAGAADARGEVLLFLHADSFPPADALALITRTLADPRAVGGAFEHRFAEPVWSLRAITWINRVRYRLTRNYYGDQGQFVRAPAFRALGGYRPLRLMEDLDFAQRLKRRGRSVLIRTPLITSGRRFLARGPWRTFFFIVWLLARWTLRLDTERYAEKWRGPANRPPGTPWSENTSGAGATHGPDPLGRELSEAGPHLKQPTHAPTRSHATRSKILVTGATGFIGREIVARLLAADRPLAVLARGRDGAGARTRVAAALGDAAALERVEIVEGDLGAVDAGLDPVDLRRLRERVETVIHCAGDTSFAPHALAPYLAGHVEGPVTLLRALAPGRLARWAHVSTAFVCGDRSGTVGEADGDVGQRLHNAYERVKLAAETAIREAGRAGGVEVSVLRPSIVVGAAPATAGGNPSNLFFTFIRLLAALAQWPGDAGVRLRIEAAPGAPFNIVPLDYVAAATIALAEHPGAAGGTFHLVVRDAPTQAAMLAMLGEHLGARGLTLVDAATAPLADPSPLERRVARMLEPYRAYLTQDVRFDDAAAATVLTACGVARPTLAPAEVHHLITLALPGPAPVSVAASHAAR